MYNGTTNLKDERKLLVLGTRTRKTKTKRPVAYYGWLVGHKSPGEPLQMVSLLMAWRTLTLSRTLRGIFGRQCMIMKCKLQRLLDMGYYF